MGTECETKYLRIVRGSKFYASVQRDCYRPPSIAPGIAPLDAYVNKSHVYWLDTDRGGIEMPYREEPSSWNRSSFQIYETEMRKACQKDLCPILPIILVDPTQLYTNTTLEMPDFSPRVAMDAMRDLTETAREGGMSKSLDDLMGCEQVTTDSAVLTRLQKMISYSSTEFADESQGVFCCDPLQESMHALLAKAWFPLAHGIRETVPETYSSYYMVHYISRTSYSPKDYSQIPSSSTLLRGVQTGMLGEDISEVERPKKFMHVTPIVHCSSNCLQQRFEELMYLTNRYPLIIWNFDEMTVSESERPTRNQIQEYEMYALQQLSMHSFGTKEDDTREGEYTNDLSDLDDDEEVFV